jgi:hypothetical protein
MPGIVCMNGSKFDQIWPRVREVIAFVGGLTIMFFEAFKDRSDRPWLYAAAIGMMGLPTAKYIENTLGRYTSSGPVEPPPEVPPPAQQQIPPPASQTHIHEQDLSDGNPGSVD